MSAMLRLSERELETLYYALRERIDRLRTLGEAEEAERLLGRISAALAAASRRRGRAFEPHETETGWTL